MMTTLQPRTRPPEVALVHRPAVTLLGLSAALLYAGSFFLPAYQEAAGFHAFVLSLVFLVGIPMWLANPFFWSGLTLLAQGKYRSARNAGLVALVLALSECWLFAEGLQVGYFVWVSSMASLAVAGWWGQLQPYSAQGTRGAGEASRIAARLAASRPPNLSPEGRDAFQEVR